MSINRFAMKIFKAMDTDKSGSVSYAEFKDAIEKGAKSGEIDEANNRKLFDALDTDKNGELSLAELSKAFTGCI